MTLQTSANTKIYQRKHTHEFVHLCKHACADTYTNTHNIHTNIYAQHDGKRTSLVKTNASRVHDYPSCHNENQHANMVGNTAESLQCFYMFLNHHNFFKKSLCDPETGGMWKSNHFFTKKVYIQSMHLKTNSFYKARLVLFQQA